MEGGYGEERGRLKRESFITFDCPWALELVIYCYLTVLELVIYCYLTALELGSQKQHPFYYLQ